MLVPPDVFPVWKWWSSSHSGWRLSQELITGSHQTPKQHGSCSRAMGSWQIGDLRWQVLARANAGVCPRGQVLLCLEKWLQLVSHAAPLLSCTSEFYRPPVTVTAIPSREGLDSLVGQLVQLLPQLWLLFEEVMNY